MITWMVYSIGVGALLTLTAHAAHRAAVLRSLPTRWIWLAAIVLSVLVPAAIPMLPREEAAATSTALIPATFTIELGASAAPVRSSLPKPADILMAGWIAGSFLLLLFGGASVLRLGRARRHWPADTIDGSSVLVSSNTGPAVIGLLRPTIVVPEWIRSLPASQRRLILDHEREHIAAHDPWLMILAQLLPALVPWNPALWWQSKRLRECVELDCDARLLARGASADHYARLLLQVGERATEPLFAVAALSEPQSLLEKRIRRILASRPRHAVLRAVVWACVGACTIVIVAAAPLPVSRAVRTAAVAQLEPVYASIAAPRVVVPPPAQSQKPPKPQEPTPPKLRDAAALREGIARYYPPLLRDAGIEGTVLLSVKASAVGNVTDVSVKKGSGHAALDDAAIKVAQLLKFTPARSGDRNVAGSVELPIEFRIEVRIGSVEVPKIQGEAGPTTPPKLQNHSEVANALQRYYPPLLRDAGVGGKVLVWFQVDEIGRVIKTQLKRGSGHAALDEAALQVAALMSFSPALNGETPVRAWIELPITFGPPPTK